MPHCDGGFIDMGTLSCDLRLSILVGHLHPVQLSSWSDSLKLGHDKGLQ